VEILSNQLLPLSPQGAQLLDRKEGSLAWDRRTLLRGRNTGTAYSYATSLIDDEGLELGFREDLRLTASGIGHLLAKYRMGTFRELLTYRVVVAPDYAQHLPNFRETSFLSRTYRIVFEGRPIMTVTENLPRSLFHKHEIT
jgi:chorismate-pyruvate lyase